MDQFQLCRLCALKSAETINIFNERTYNIKESIGNILHIEIKEHDILPKTICEKCYFQVVNFTKFEKKCQEAQSTLNDLLIKRKKTNDEVVVKIEIQRSDSADFDSEAIIITPAGNAAGLKSEDSNDYHFVDDNSDLETTTDDYYVEYLESEEESTWYEILNKTTAAYRQRNACDFSHQLECCECSEIKRGPKQLELHFHSVHKKNVIYKCSICFKKFFKYRSFTRHVLLHTEGHKFECHECHKTFGQKVGLQNHLHTHTIGSQYTCNLCGKEYRHVSSLYKHFQKHSTDVIKCEICCAELASVDTLKNHMKAYHIKEKQEICNVCEKRFATKPALYYHLKIHKKTQFLEETDSSNLITEN